MSAAARNRWLAALLALAVAGYLALAWRAGGADTLAAIGQIGAVGLALGLLVTLASFGLRAGRWLLLLHRLGAVVPWPRSVAIYLAGLSLSASPGKLGETVRSVFLASHGVPVGTSLAAFFVDRLSDLLAVLALAACAAWLSGTGQETGTPLAWWALAAAVLGASLALRLAGGAGSARRLAGRLPSRWFGWIVRMADGYVRLWTPGLAPVCVLLSFAAFGLQGLVYAYFVDAVAPAVPAWTALAIFATSTLAGAASLVPGGLGAMDLSLVLLLQAQGVAAPQALAAALALRVVTFWFGLLVGALALKPAAAPSTHD